MGTIKRIFKDDMRNLIKHFFALIIIIGVCFLPALYAWFNIYSNWDPYGNTEGLKLAAVSMDKGYTNENGEYQNVGEGIIEELRENKSVEWHFVKDEKEALAGIKDGTYYAAVVISEDFTYNMYNMFTEEVEQPAITFYQNQKKNPVANKISDTVVEKVQDNVNEEFIKVMTKMLFEDANAFASDLEKEGGVDGFIEKVSRINDEMLEYVDVIDSVISSNAALSASIEGTKKDVSKMEEGAYASGEALKNAQGEIETTQVTLNDYQKQVNITLQSMQSLLNTMHNELEAAKLSNDANQMMEAGTSAVESCKQLTTDLNALAQALNSAGALGGGGVNNAVTAIGQMQDTVGQIEAILGGMGGNPSQNNIADKIATQEKNMLAMVDDALVGVQKLQNSLNNDLMPAMNENIESLSQIIGNANELMMSMGQTLGSMGDVFSALQSTVSYGNTSLDKTKDALLKMSEKLTTMLDKVSKAREDEKVEIIMNTLSGNPEQYAEFFSEPVHIDTEKVYSIDNYGSAVTPFYTVLAIWVGVIILAAIVRVKPTASKYPDAKPYELFFGRYTTYFVLGQIQTLITVLGDLYILKVQCEHPLLFWLVSAFTSLVFTIFIYSLAVSFGDVGKAAVVVIVVLQIAGSSGTYPIELLPEFFQRVYIFFPFPYAINAMRECISGIYEYDLLIYILKLSIFIIVGLVIGLWIRKPFEELNHYMEERMEDTEMM
ncbi:MAG: YhgE/Pip domain-containing protein [Lachnospiraceae bacterium]|nr:YhgE/Pip domain-containing protein [Lachnospiraceae bacterium]MDD7378538.1 YhgE/Pip domain-containing protein [Lachnospiraceae bacterium]MDY4616296.1 YhgE/Pip domain-containing protein [Lachnospiraceae bacterium]